MAGNFNVKRIRTKLHVNEVAWNQAITDAQQQLETAQTRAKRLHEIIAALQKMKDAGEPWPGTISNIPRYDVTKKTV